MAGGHGGYGEYGTASYQYQQSYSIGQLYEGSEDDRQDRRAFANVLGFAPPRLRGTGAGAAASSSGAGSSS